MPKLTDQDVVKNAKDLTALSAYFKELVERVGKQDNKALEICADLATNAMLYAQPYLIHALPGILECVGHKKSSAETRALAEKAIKAIIDNISANAVQGILPVLFDAMGASVRWQTRVAALRAIAGFGDHAPEQLGYALPLVIPEVSKCIVDLKKEVCEAAEAAMTAVCDVVGNKDMEHLTADILRSITHPEETAEIMHKLAGVTFVQSVESPALAMVTPLLIKGLNHRQYATVRQSAVIIDNMSRLVDDPLDAAPFMPLLMPVLEKAADMMSDPEARSVCERAVAQLQRLNGEVQDAQERQQHIDPVRILAVIKEQMGSKNEEYLDHVAALCASLMSVRKFGKEAWKEIASHLAVVDQAKADAGLEHIRKECEKMAKPLPSKEEAGEDPALELCNW
jgi:elongation factor 3